MSSAIPRRNFLGAAAAAAGLAMAGCRKGAVDTFIQTRLSELDRDALLLRVAEMEKEYSARFGKTVTVDATPATEGVLFAYGLDLDRCNGNRLCVQACVEENNQSRGDERAQPIEWITVLEMGPVEATWKEPDGIVVIDYDWCIGCRCCMSACPYGARHFNWAEPQLTAEQLNPETHVLGNRPRPRGIVEKCTFCVQRTRKGLYPACHEACPTGARVFGNLLDPASAVRRLIERKRVFILKAELNTRPSFFYFYG